ncbi:hypothetical protein Tco_0067243 [Tanacetum coccineum]
MKKVVVRQGKLKEAQTSSGRLRRQAIAELRVTCRVACFLESITTVESAFWYQGRACPRFIGPFKILIALFEVSYRLALASSAYLMFTRCFMFHFLRGYKYHPLHVVYFPFDRICEGFIYTEGRVYFRQSGQSHEELDDPFLSKSFGQDIHPELEGTWETEESITGLIILIFFHDPGMSFSAVHGF